MRRYYAYVRVSTAKQGEHGVSLQEQRAAITRCCQTNHIEITEWFEERVTAAKSGRPVFGEMLKRLRHGEAEGVVIHKIDRSARNLRDWANLGELIDQGIDVRFANESIDLNSRGGRLSADIQAVVAADFIRNLREETRKGIYGRLKQGYYPMPAPLGYANNGRGTIKTICPSTGPLIRMAFELYASERFSIDSLVEEMHQSGLRNRKGGKVTRTGMGVILSNPFYVGLIRLRSTKETFIGQHEPLVGNVLFERVQAILHGRAPKQVIKHDFLFTHLLSCGTCTHALVGERQKGHIYYRCHRKTCRQTCMSEKSVDDSVADALKPLNFAPEERVLWLAIATELRADFQQKQKNERATLRMRVGSITERIAKLTDAFVDGAIDKRLFDERNTALQMERLRIEEILQDPDTEQDAGTERLQKFVELAGSAYLSYKSANDSEKRELVKAVCSNRTITGKNVSIKLFPAFNELSIRPEFTNGVPYRATVRTFLAHLWDNLNNVELDKNIMPQHSIPDQM